MKEIKLMVDGKEVQLTDEQLKMLGIEVRKSPFERVTGEEYYYIDMVGGIVNYKDIGGSFDDTVYAELNYFNDEAFAKQVALHQLLYRKLLKFAYDNECEDTAEWNGINSHWTIRYNGKRYGFSSYSQERYQARDVYFASEEGAKRAIEEVVNPFMKEHPDFVW